MIQTGTGRGTCACGSIDAHCFQRFTFCLETRSSSIVLSFDAMGWTASCQKAHWNQYSTGEWTSWVDTLPEDGFGRLTKIEWKEWIQKMLDAHGPSTKDAPTTATEDVNQADLSTVVLYSNRRCQPGSFVNLRFVFRLRGTCIAMCVPTQNEMGMVFQPVSESRMLSRAMTNAVQGSTEPAQGSTCI